MGNPGHSPCNAAAPPEHAPMSSAKPPTGRRHVPVTNCNSRILFSLSISLTTYDKNTAGVGSPLPTATQGSVGPMVQPSPRPRVPQGPVGAGLLSLTLLQSHR